MNALKRVHFNMIKRLFIYKLIQIQCKLSLATTKIKFQYTSNLINYSTGNMLEWKIPETLMPFIGELCPKGTYVECKICCDWDKEGKKFSCVQIGKKFWFGYFTDHIRSTRHKSNMAKKGNVRRGSQSNWSETQTSETNYTLICS